MKYLHIIKYNENLYAILRPSLHSPRHHKNRKGATDIEPPFDNVSEDTQDSFQQESRLRRLYKWRIYLLHAWGKRFGPRHMEGIQRYVLQRF